MQPRLRPLRAALLTSALLATTALAQIRDGGIDPWNLGKGDWVYYMSMATNKLGGNIPAVTNETSLMLWYKSQGIRYFIVKAATSDYLFKGSYSFPQFTSNLVNIAHANGLLIFGYNRTYGSNVLGEIAIADYVFNQGADGFVYDGESEWESSQPWIGNQGPQKAWQLCSTVRSNWPTKFIAHAPFPIISLHSSFPYKEFGYWCDAVMPQIYPQGWTSVFSRPSGGICWTDANWKLWQDSLYSLAPTNINGLTVYWTNAIKPLAPVNHAYGPNPPNSGVSEIRPEFVMEFIDYLSADVNAQTAGGYKGANFWRADLHGAKQWTNLAASTIGSFPGIVNNIVMDNLHAVAAGSWTSVRTFYASANGKSVSFQGNGSGSDTNSFGTNYVTHAPGTGTDYVEYTPHIQVPGEYSVYEWHPSLLNASASAPFLVKHAGGTTLVYANQRTNGGAWSFLGRFTFPAGQTPTIRVLDNVPEPGAVAVTDGLKLVFFPPAWPPLPPSGLTATPVSASQIDLSWQDNSTNETSFVIARSTNSAGPFADVATVPFDTTQYSDPGLTDSTTYYYRVRAVNYAGASTNSNIAAATTFVISRDPPEIIGQPISFGALEGRAAAFAVTATGTPILRYQWRLGGVPIAGATDSVYSIAAVGTNAVGAYSVVVTNLYGSATSSPALLGIVPVGGFGDNTFNQSIVHVSATNVIAIAAGAWHSLALRADGSIAAWGYNWDGQCDVPAGLSDALAIAAGGYHSVALRRDGSVSCWGANEHGQATAPAGLSDVVAVAAGDAHTLALNAAGTVLAWGDNACGQTRVPHGLTGVAAIAAGARHSLALKTDGHVVAWGDNADNGGCFVGQSSVPLGLSNVVGIAAGQAHSLAILADGRVIAWGDNSEGQCSPPSELSGVAAVVAGGAHSAALTTNGTVVAWGANWLGQCDIPADLTNLVAVATRGDHTLVLCAGAVPVPRLLRPSWQMGRFSALYQTLLLNRYTLEFKNSPGDTHWMAMPPTSGNGALRVLNDPAAGTPHRVYRVRQ
jgi:hypothetical protein